jgi:hypothetical protein
MDAHFDGGAGGRRAVLVLLCEPGAAASPVAGTARFSHAKKGAARRLPEIDGMTRLTSHDRHVAGALRCLPSTFRECSTMAGNFTGFAKLKQPEDLYRKLVHDRERMQVAPLDLYAAFDFFVTAEHMRDWVLPGYKGAKGREALRKDNLVLRLVSHLANGSKHFQAEDKRHQSVEDVTEDSYAEPDYVKDDYWEQKLVIHLTLSEQDALGFPFIAAVELADRTLQFWADYLDRVRSRRA